ncbi:50S ribosomal protein L4 [Desulfovibrio sp. 86]|jgi:large subunit ribosomal protein L4|uniref:Large ribosomal subunit protein uL4 n=1 Tax=uncultured Desulfovibrio sp. TaxID=167968 RepID=A0A212L1S7_9BACT|nr:50S ribosomal protein L4 [Desulfovibrio sp. 86]SCM71319.1 50S ribosomal protein L4 [uncultured Desulfovibrio sp.]VZH32866.1 50S ribosomal protein L4 [Desulfovibrio sp. 86]
MATVKVFDQNKQESGEVTLASDVFEIEVRPEILNLVARAQMAAKRAGTHNAKTRAFVSGGGVKPWKQKGTGRARAGSNRSPIWRGGAIIFGPSPRDYSFKVNSKVRALALKMALSSRLAAETLMVVKGIELPEAKTKHFAKVANTLGLNKALIVAHEESVELTRSVRNIPGLTLTTVDRLSVLEILKHKQLVLLEGAVESVQARFAKKGA